MTTENLAPTKHWQDLPLIDLPSVKLPSRTREHLVKQGIDSLGKLAEALDDVREVGLGHFAEQCRAAIEDLRSEQGEESTPIHVPEGAGSDGASEKVQAGRLPDREEAWRRINLAAAEVDEKEQVHLVCSERAKDAKKALEASRANLRETVRWANTPIAAEPANLFSEVGDAPKSPAKSGTAAAPNKAIEDCWRHFPLTRFTQFGLSNAVIESLGSKGIATLGDLADYTKPNDSGYCKRLTDLDGIGANKVMKIEEATTAFWSMWPSKRDAFAQELGLFNGNASKPGIGSEDPCNGEPSDGNDPAEPANVFGELPANPEPRFKETRSRRKAK